MPCFYCLNQHTHISICVACRTKFESLLEENKRLRRNLDLTRISMFKEVKQKTKALKKKPRKRSK